jgi:hypothetical protein
MSAESIALWFVRLLGVYAGVGLLFALAFSSRGVEKLDPAAEGSGWGFRLIILPASIALWPWLLARWRSGASGQPIENNEHRRRAAESAK